MIGSGFYRGAITQREHAGTAKEDVRHERGTIDDGEDDESG